jgi:hypothetical protein
MILGLFEAALSDVWEKAVATEKSKTKRVEKYLCIYKLNSCDD